MRISTGLAILKSVQRFSVRINDITTPFVVVHGTKDRMTDIMGSRMLIAKTKSVDKNLIEVEGAAHVLFEESSEIVDAFMRQVLGWLNARL
jgi:acylglycerol lipase